jgi:hypothetical protein
MNRPRKASISGAAFFIPASSKEDKFLKLAMADPKEHPNSRDNRCA